MKMAAVEYASSLTLILFMQIYEAEYASIVILFFRWKFLRQSVSEVLP